MDEKTLEERLSETELRLDKAMAEIANLRSFVTDIDKRLLSNDKQTDKVLDTTQEIKELLTGNNKDTRSAKRNAKFWGFSSVFISICFKLGEILVRSKIAL